MYSLLAAALLGAVEGLTEFLPVSSTGHIIIVSQLLGLENKAVKTLEIVILLGSILAVIVVFRHLLINLVNSYFNRLSHSKSNQLTLNHILVGTGPTIVLGLIFYDMIKSMFNLINIIYALVIGSVLLITAEILKPRAPRAKKLDDITYSLVFLIGCFQCLALFPGFSRAGATISGGMLMGVSRYAASQFSFLLAVPVVTGATVLDLYKSRDFLASDDIPMFVVGFLTAFIVSLITISICLQIIKRISFISLAIYRLILAVIVYVVFT